MRRKQKEAIDRLRSGEAHPQREAVLEWARLADVRHNAWSDLTDAERLTTETDLHAVYFDYLRPPELGKIRQSLAALAHGWKKDDAVRSMMNRPRLMTHDPNRACGLGHMNLPITPSYQPRHARARCRARLGTRQCGHVLRSG